MSAQVVDKLISRAVKDTNASAPVASSKDQQSTHHAGEADEIRRRVVEAETSYNLAARSRSSAFAIVTPLLIALSFTLTFLDSKYQIAGRLGYWDLLKSSSISSPLFYLAISFMVLTPIYYFHFRKRYVAAKDALNVAVREQQAFFATRLSTVEGRKNHIRQELFKLSSKAAHVFYGDAERFTLASTWAKGIGDILDGEDKAAGLNVAENCLFSLNELVAREEREQAEEVLWQKWAISVMFVFVTLLIAAAIPTYYDQEMLAHKVFGVPLSVIVWGAAGSLAAILYRFYTEQGRIRFSAEFRWLIARPIIGIIMGAVVYLALISGLVLISPSGGGPTEEIARPQVFWLVAFLAGFSDKFYLGVIDLLVARTVKSQEIDNNTVVTEKTRVPEATAVDGQDAKKPHPAQAVE